MTEYTSDRIKHLELIQSVVSRMSSNSTTIKRYAIVLSAAAVTFARLQDHWVPLVFGCLLIIVFAFLDARYLQLERQFRDLYDAVRAEPPDTRPDFRLKPIRDGHSLAEAAWSWSVLGLYTALLFFLLSLTPFTGV